MNIIDKLKKMNIANVIVSSLFVAWIAAGCFMRNMEYFSSFFILSAIFGGTATCGAVGWKKYLKKQQRKVDVNFYQATLDQLFEAEAYAKDIMLETGWKGTGTDDYIDGWKVCNDYVIPLIYHMKEWFYENVPAQRGLSIGIEPFAYDVDKENSHSVVECYLDGGNILLDCYPQHRGIMKITDDQYKSAWWVNF